jgi:hypothetical protein
MNEQLPGLRLRSPGVIVGGVLLLVVGAACASGGGDDDCDTLGPRPRVFAAGGSGLRVADVGVAEVQSRADNTLAAAVPARGGFGTHLASCGG